MKKTRRCTGRRTPISQQQNSSLKRHYTKDTPDQRVSLRLPSGSTFRKFNDYEVGVRGSLRLKQNKTPPVKKTQKKNSKNYTSVPTLTSLKTLIASSQFRTLQPSRYELYPGSSIGAVIVSRWDWTTSQPDLPTPVPSLSEIK